MIPPCRQCGRVPTEYERRPFGMVECAGASRHACYVRLQERVRALDLDHDDDETATRREER